MEPASDSSMPEVVLDADFLAQLNSPDSRALLDTIDSLREIHVGDLVDLPQIIVVGDQSSGKSSVLEAISRVRFPVDGDLCTRFATELILRRSNKVAVNVSIQPANDAASTTHGGGGERRPFQRSTFNEDALPDIIREAKELMGIGENGVKKFSRDILRVEIAKPDMYPITLVDLPGIFHSETADQDLEGKQIVDQLIESYMSQEKSIILAVVATNNQLANQSVLQEAKKHDPERKRTIGVITKPDLADPGSANERKYLDLAKGRENMHNLALGWYVLRNSSEQERSSGAENRDTVEERFFATGAWSSISPANRGVESLRKRLSRVLLDHVKASLPGLIQDIRTNLRTRQEDLDRLGKARSSTEEQRSYLLGVAHEYQRLAHDAIEGRYSNNLGFFGGIGQSEKKLRAVIRNSNRAFHAVMESKGGRYKILREDEDNASDSLHEVNHQLPEYVRFLIEEYDIPDPETKDESTLKAELQSLACFNHGREFPGEANEELALQLFRDQAEPWQDIAWKHLKQVLRVTQDFVDRAFIHVIGADEKTQEAILNCYVNPFFESKEEELSGKLGELLLPYSNGYGPPLEAEFISIMRRRTNERLAVRLSRQFQEDLEFDQDEHLNRDKILRTFRNLEDSDIDEFGTEKVIDLMTAYYEMSLRTFIDNIINLAAESCLIRDIPTILTPMKVDAMSANTLEELASESEEVQIQRRRLEDEVKILREGLRKCQRHERRELPARPTASVRHSSGAAPGQTPSRAVTPSPAPTPGRDSTSSLAASASHQPKIISPNVMLRASQTSSSQTLSSQGRDFSSTPSPSLFGGSPGHTSSSLSQPIFGTNTGAAKPAPTSSLFTSTASRPQDGNTGDTTGSGATGGRLFGEGFVNTNTAVPFGGSGPSISRSAFGAATNLQNTSSGARHNRHSGA
ncbi:P-loop containing nucleoside triphosphate hydrolase protein [Corynascus novoguineensis]|uniref:P-loop containing nucleoside triphosphate hydrolase protein n=1 Tax=Corynascus novoguineensis TaxID=1126955 RepID=A0AAN7HNR4_9PEZI|nr:P-loop containing nucleoside triphosphate hydrolase protein [Corynascus novoguineensis]